MRQKYIIHSYGRLQNDRPILARTDERRIIDVIDSTRHGRDGAWPSVNIELPSNER